MKCTNCGKKIKNNICEYCGTINTCKKETVEPKTIDNKPYDLSKIEKISSDNNSIQKFEENQKSEAQNRSGYQSIVSELPTLEFTEAKEWKAKKEKQLKRMIYRGLGIDKFLDKINISKPVETIIIIIIWILFFLITWLIIMNRSF